MHTSSITFPSNGGSTPAILARRGDGPFPALSPSRNGGGWSRTSKTSPGCFAQAGFVALAPDLYHGQVAGEPDEARSWPWSWTASGPWLRFAPRPAICRGWSSSPRQDRRGRWCMGGSRALLPRGR